MAGNLSSGYHYVGMTNEAVPDYVFVIGPAGTISSTANDMAAFLAAHMKNGFLARCGDPLGRDCRPHAGTGTLQRPAV